MKPSFKNIEHLVRLAALFLAAILVFAVARAALVPDDFGTLGFYRAGSLGDVGARTPSYAGRVRCVECHEDVTTTAAPSRHKNIGCENCHGALRKHADDPEVAPPKLDGRADCLRCHAANAGRPATFLNIDAAEHSGDDPCSSCHKPHDPRAESGEGDEQHTP